MDNSRKIISTILFSLSGTGGGERECGYWTSKFVDFGAAESSTTGRGEQAWGYWSSKFFEVIMGLLIWVYNLDFITGGASVGLLELLEDKGGVPGIEN